MKKPFTIQEWLNDKTQRVIDSEGNLCMIVRIDFQDADRGTVIHCKKSDREYYYPLVENDLFLLDSISVDAPEGLDEAAEEFIRDFANRVFYSSEATDEVDLTEQVKRTFRAGAEWAFGQIDKEAVEGIAEELYTDDETHCTVGVGTYFKPGDEVYVIPQNCLKK